MLLDETICKAETSTNGTRKGAFGVPSNDNNNHIDPIQLKSIVVSLRNKKES